MCNLLKSTFLHQTSQSLALPGINEVLFKYGEIAYPLVRCAIKADDLRYVLDRYQYPALQDPLD